MYFSIIIPLFNKRSTIARTLSSILGQSFSDYEVLVVNDGSTDGSEDIVKAIDDKRIKVFTIPNSGPAAARNFGVQQAEADWLIFLDADDLLVDGALKQFATDINTHPCFDMHIGNFIQCKNGKEYLYSHQYTDKTITTPFKDWFMGNFLPRTGAYSLRRIVQLKYSFNPNLRRYEDAEQLFKIFRTTSIRRFSSPVMIYNRDDSSASKPRADISEDFLGHLDFKGKGFWESMVLYDLYIEAKNLYPADVCRVYPNLERKKLWLKLAYAAASRYRYAIKKSNR